MVPRGSYKVPCILRWRSCISTGTYHIHWKVQGYSYNSQGRWNLRLWCDWPRCTWGLVDNPSVRRFSGCSRIDSLRFRSFFWVKSASVRGLLRLPYRRAGKASSYIVAASWSRFPAIPRVLPMLKSSYLLLRICAQEVVSLEAAADEGKYWIWLICSVSLKN